MIQQREIRGQSLLGVKKVNPTCIHTSVYTWKGRTPELRLIATNNSHVVVRIEMRNAGKLFLFSNNPIPLPAPFHGLWLQKIQTRIYHQSCTGPFCKFHSTQLFHDFTKGKIFIHNNISFETNYHIRQTLPLNQPNVVWQLTQEETIFTQCLIDETVTRLLRNHKRKKRCIFSISWKFHIC